MRSDHERLLDIRDSIEHINKYAASGKEAFGEDELIQTWVLHHLQILGEAAANISDELKHSCSQIAWHKIVGMRNILVHGYFGIDIDVVWQVVQDDLPELEQQLKKLGV